MPWDRDQSIAILLQAQRSGNRKLASKAKASLRGTGKKAPKRKKR